MNPRRTLASLAILVAAIHSAQAQSIIKTLLGGAPNNVPALGATLNNPVGVVTDTSGNMYVSLQTINQVIKIDSNGTATVFAGTGGTGFGGDGGPAVSAILSFPVGLAVDANGNVLIADAGNNRIRKVSPNGTISTVAGGTKAAYAGDGGPATSASLNGPLAIALDAKGNLFIADTSNSVIRVVNPNGIISTFAGLGNQAQGGDLGPANQAALDEPWGVAVDGAGDVYIADTGNNTVRIVTPDGIINRFAGQYYGAYSGDNGYATGASLNQPTSLAVDKAGIVYILDQNNHRVRRVTPDGIITTYAGCGLQGGAGDDGLATGASLNARGITIDPYNNLLIADGTNGRVREVSAANGVIQTVAGNGLTSISPGGIAVNGNMLYYSDSSNRVRAVNLVTGVLSVIAGTGAASFSGDGSSAVNATLNNPRGIALDGTGNIYIADAANQRVRRVDTQGNITTIAGNGTASTSGDGGPGTSASMNAPEDVAVDSNGNVYIAESGGGRIRKLSSSGTITTVAGSGSDSSGTGLGTNQSLSNPSGVAVEPSGTVLISDSSHNRVLRLSSDGTVSIAAGTGVASFSGDGGPATSATLRAPVGVRTDPTGNIYIADAANDAIRQVGTDGIITTVAGMPASSGRGTSGYNGDGSPATAHLLAQPTAVAPTANCTVLIADTSNQLLRELWTSVQYTIRTNPAGLQVIVDGQQAATPATFNWLPGTQHQLASPASQPGPTGTQYLAGNAQTVSVPCGPARQSATITAATQYLLTVTASSGGAIAPAQGWENAGSQVTLSATPYPGYVFAGWTGDCSGQGSCQLTMNGPKTIGATFNASGTGPSPNITGVATAGAFGGGTTIAPGTWLEIYGTNLSSLTRQWTSADFTGNLAPTSLSGVSVTISGQPAFVSYISGTQINAQAPGGLSPGPVAVVVSNGFGASDPATVAAAASEPELYAPFGNKYVAAFEGTSIVGSPGYASAKPGDAITLFGIGFGAVTPSIPPGQIAATTNTLAAAFTVSIGGVNAAVQYDGLSLASVGLYQFNIVVPNVPDGEQPVAFALGGTASNQSLLLSVQH